MKSIAILLKKIFCSGWLYSTVFVIYLLVYGETKGNSRYVVLFHEPTGNLYHALLIDPEYNHIWNKFNIFDDDDVYNIKSFGAKYVHYIGNIKKEPMVDNKMEFKTIKFLPNRNYVDFNQLPEIIQKSTATIDVSETDVSGFESLGLNKFTLIIDESAERFEKRLKERADKFKGDAAKKM
ncbi:MAG: hypothetical protein WCP10_15865 [Desulfuromonadales bacterium]